MNKRYTLKKIHINIFLMVKRYTLIKIGIF